MTVLTESRRAADPVDSPIRQVSTTSPITSTTDPDLACGLGAQPAALTVPAHPGSNISIDWASTEPPPSYVRSACIYTDFVQGGADAVASSGSITLARS